MFLPGLGSRRSSFILLFCSAWMWHSWKSRLFTFGFVAVRCHCFIPGKKLTVVSLFFQFYPLGTVYCYKYIYINNIKKIICPVNPFNEIFLYRLWVNAKEFKWCEKLNRFIFLESKCISNLELFGSACFLGCCWCILNWWNLCQLWAGLGQVGFVSDVWCIQNSSNRNTNALLLFPELSKGKERRSFALCSLQC